VKLVPAALPENFLQEAAKLPAPSRKAGGQDAPRGPRRDGGKPHAPRDRDGNRTSNRNARPRRNSEVGAHAGKVRRAV
jgi:ATP-dependent RNA helicase RhlE